MPEDQVIQEIKKTGKSHISPEKSAIPSNAGNKDSRVIQENKYHTHASAEQPDKNGAGEIQAAVKILITPISGQQVCGEDPRYNAEFESAKAEIEKPGATNYQLITKNCREILETQAKDIRVFGFLMLSSAIEEGPAICLDIISAMKYCFLEYWENIHPKRDIARINAIKWLNQEKVLGLLEKMKVDSSHHSHLNAICLHLEEINNFIRHKFPQSPPSLGGLIKYFTSLASKYKPNEALKTEVHRRETGSGAPSASTNASFNSISDSASALTALQKGSQFIIESFPENPIGCKIMRVLKWQPIRQAPRAIGNVVKIQGPNEQMMAYYPKMMEQQNWNEIIVKGESAFTHPGLHFWLDLQYYIHSAYKNLGESYRACASALEDELAALMSRAPELLNYKYQNNIPFAGFITSDWIKKDILGKANYNGGEMAEFYLSEEIENAKSKARELAVKGKLSQALLLLQNTSRGRDAHIAAQLKYLMAELSLQSQRPDVAEGIIEGLSLHLSDTVLSDWDPEFFGAFCNLKLIIYTSLTEKKDLTQTHRQELAAKARAAFLELSRLNPGAASRANFALK